MKEELPGFAVRKGLSERAVPQSAHEQPARQVLAQQVLVQSEGTVELHQSPPPPPLLQHQPMP